MHPLLDRLFAGFVFLAENPACLKNTKPKKGQSKEVDTEAKPPSFNERYQEAKVKIFNGLKITV